jgi:hypothetical protein
MTRINLSLLSEQVESVTYVEMGLVESIVTNSGSDLSNARQTGEALKFSCQVYADPQVCPQSLF